MPGQQLALCVAQRFELGADLEFVVVWLGVDYPGPQFEAEPLRQQDHAQDEQLADRQCAVVAEADSPSDRLTLRGSPISLSRLCTMTWPSRSMRLFITFR